MSDPNAGRPAEGQDWTEPRWNGPPHPGSANPGRPGESATTATLPAIGREPNAFDRHPGQPANAGQPGNAVQFSGPSPRPPGPTGAPGAVGTPSATNPPAGAGASARAAAAAAVRKARPRRADGAPRRARLQLRHVNAWSVLKFSCVLAVALFFVWLIVVGILYGVLDAAGVFDKVNSTVRTINGSSDAQDVITPTIVFGGAAVIGAINIVLFIALSTIGSVIYNLCADLVGGIEVTLSERE